MNEASELLDALVDVNERAALLRAAIRQSGVKLEQLELPALCPPLPQANVVPDRWRAKMTKLGYSVEQEDKS